MPEKFKKISAKVGTLLKRQGIPKLKKKQNDNESMNKMDKAFHNKLEKTHKENVEKEKQRRIRELEKQRKNKRTNY